MIRTADFKLVVYPDPPQYHATEADRHVQGEPDVRRTDLRKVYKIGRERSGVQRR